jgi:hypothetical protein
MYDEDLDLDLHQRKRKKRIAKVEDGPLPRPGGRGECTAKGILRDSEATLEC